MGVRPFGFIGHEQLAVDEVEVPLADPPRAHLAVGRVGQGDHVRHGRPEREPILAPRDEADPPVKKVVALARGIERVGDRSDQPTSHRRRRGGVGDQPLGRHPRELDVLLVAPPLAGMAHARQQRRLAIQAAGARFAQCRSLRTASAIEPRSSTCVARRFRFRRNHRPSCRQASVIHPRRATRLFIMPDSVPQSQLAPLLLSRIRPPTKTVRDRDAASVFLTRPFLRHCLHRRTSYKRGTDTKGIHGTRR